MKKSRYAGILWMAVSIFLTAGMTSFASAPAAQPDASRKGAVTVDLFSADSGEAIAGGTLNLYEVAQARQTEGETSLTYTDAFADCPFSLEKAETSEADRKELAEQLEGYVQEKQIDGQTAAVDADGHAAWTELEQGLYLVTQTSPANGYAPVRPFLVTIPEVVNGAYVYEVNARPKAGTADVPDGKTPSQGKTEIITDDRLPQTGQLWWPVPLLALAGMLLFFLGWYQRKRYRDEAEK